MHVILLLYIPMAFYKHILYAGNFTIVYSRNQWHSIGIFCMQVILLLYIPMAF